MRRALRHAGLLAVTVLSATASTAVAQLAEPGPYELEGPIEGIDPGTGAITIMGIRVLVETGRADSATRLDIPFTELLTPGLPGRKDPRGFVTGTAIIGGDVQNGVFTADEGANVEVDPAENLILSEITSTSPLTVSGIVMEALTDARLPALPPVNGLGLKIAVRPGDAGLIHQPAEAEGYYSELGEKKFYWHHLTIDAAPLLDPNKRQVGLERVRCIAGDRLEARGGIYDPDGPPFAGTVGLYLPDAEDPIIADTEPFRPVADRLNMATYRIRVDFAGDCPAVVLARWLVQEGTKIESEPMIVDER